MTTWARLSRPVTCREVAAAMCRAGLSHAGARDRMAAFGRWDDECVRKALLRAGFDTEAARVKRALRCAPEKRPYYQKLRRHGLGQVEALAALEAGA